MKFPVSRLILSALCFGLAACQDPLTTSATESGQVQLGARLFMASGASIPEADTVRFTLNIGGRAVDTAVPWSLHSLDLGPVATGTRIRWQASAWTWDATKTKRTVVWASQPKDTLAAPTSNTTAFTLETPVVSTSIAPPVPVPSSFAPDSTGRVQAPSGKDTTFTFTFTATVSTRMVKINDTVVAPVSDTTYTTVLVVRGGGSRTVRVFIEDSLGSATVSTYVIERKASTVVADTTITTSFVNPGSDTTVANATSTLPVTVKVASALHTDSVKIGSVKLARGADTTIWTGAVTNLVVGVDTLNATAYAGNRTSVVSRKVTRLAAVVVADTGLSLTFVSPSFDTIVPNATSSVALVLKTNSVRHVDSVKVGALKLIRGLDTARWTGTVSNLAVGEDSLIGFAYAGASRIGTSIVVRRQASTAVDSTIALSFTIPGADTTVANATSSVAVSVRATSVFRIDSVKIGNAYLTKGSDSTKWTGTVTGLAVGSDTLHAVAYSLGRARGQASRLVTRQAPAVRDLTLSWLGISDLVPAFSPTVKNYTVTWDSNVSGGGGGYTLADTTVSVTATGASCVSGYCSFTLGAAGSTNLIVIKVYSGIDTARYNVRVNRRPAAPTFTPAGGTVPKNQQVTIGATAADTIQVSGDSATWTNYTTPVVVTATGKLYARSFKSGVVSTVSTASYSVATAVAHDSTLNSLYISGYPFKSPFQPGVLSYSTDSLPSNYVSVTVTAVPTDAAARVTFNGSSSGVITLTGRSTPVSVVVTNGTSTLTYSVSILMAAPPVTPTGPHDTTLYSLSIGSVGFTSTFQSSRLSYTTDSLPSNYVSVTVYAMANDANATVTYNGSASGVITLTGTSTPVSVVVANGTSTLTYTINILMKQEPVGPDASLAWIGFGSLSPAFSSSVYNYTAAMSNGSGGLCYPTDANATIELTNADYAVIGGSGYCSPKLSTLSVGQSTVVTITVTNGGSQKTYSVTVTRN
jgi:hypothetical protein